MMEAETGVMQLQAEERRELLAKSPEARREASNLISLKAFGRDQPCCPADALILDF